MNLNKVFLIGRLTKDVELRTTPSGQPVASFGVATNRSWVNRSGQKQEEVEFHNVVVWGRQAEIANQYLAKGRLVMIEGRLRTRNWESKGGEKHFRTEIIAERIQFGPKALSQEKLELPQQPAGEPIEEIKLDEEGGLIEPGASAKETWAGPDQEKLGEETPF